MQGDDSITRHITASKVIGGEVQPTAFLLRAGECGLSVNWLEYYGRPAENRNITSVADCLRRKGREIKKSHFFAVLPISQVRSEAVSVRHDPEYGEGGEVVDPSHSEIAGLPPFSDLDTGDQMVAAERLVQAIDRHVSVADL
jgi:hypothetical protein